MAKPNISTALGARLRGHIESVSTKLYGVPTSANGTQLRYRGKRALSVDTQQQVFFDFETGVGGGVFQLILNYHEGDLAGAKAWTKSYLAGKPVLPSPRQFVDGQDDPWKREIAVLIAEQQQSAAGTSVELYLAKRGIVDSDLLAEVGYLPAFRDDEDAMVVQVLDDDLNVVAVQLTFITSDGEKSPIEPSRLTYKIDPQWSAKGAVCFGGDGDFIVCEGVEDAMSCTLATGRPALAVLGTSNFGKYVPEGARHLTICPDGDDPESAAAKAIQRAVDNYLLAGVREILLAPISWNEDDQRKVDANDVLRNQGCEALREIIEAAEPAHLSYKGEVRRLAAMGPDERAVQIKPTHDAMKARGIVVRLSDLRAAVDKARAEVETEQLRRTAITSTAPPSATLMEGGDLLLRLVETVRRHVVIDEGQALLAALYVLFTHMFQHFDCCPRLIVTAPTRAAGKTRLASLIGSMCARKLPASNASVAALFRVIDREAPTLIIGEYDTFMKGSEDHRNIVNSGHDREEAYVLRTVGEDFEPRHFSTFAPMILSGIGTLHRTIMSRSIVIAMRRRLGHEPISRIDDGVKEKLKVNQGLIARWALHADAILPTMPPPSPVQQLDDRANDNAAPLLAIARLCGEAWESKCRAALVAAYQAANQPDDDDLNILALRDLRDCFVVSGQAHAGGVVFTADVISHFLNMPDRPWAEMPKNGREITTHKLGWILRGFVPTGDRVSRDGERQRGFRWGSCEDAFARYLPAYSDPDAATSDAEPAPEDDESVQASKQTSGANAAETPAGGRLDVSMPPDQGDSSSDQSPPPNPDLDPADEVL